MRQAPIEQVSLEDVQTFIGERKGIVIDTLVQEHYEARHIPEAVNACVYEIIFVSSVAEVAPDKEKPVLLYGAGPQSLDSITAAEKLQREGYTDVSVFFGGLEEWREAGLPLEGQATGEVALPHPHLVLSDRRYTLLPEESTCIWVGRSSTVRHHGTIGFADGYLDAQGDLSARFTLDMTSIQSINLEGDALKPVLEMHLMSDDFFFTAMFPTATFETTAIKVVKDGEASRPNGMMQGLLSLRGMSQDIAFPVHIRNLEDDRIVVIGDLDFDRTQWGVIYGSSRFFAHLGYHSVYDFVSVDYRLVFA
ncbi:YceI family protein [Pseudodesulfovibrio sediminis]|uniref:Sulfurtransferase n=1 Tax=Pseudodesulfovibrio sediminis TaxID=2810563 RepID=A0ABM7PAB4_9BACT|nr:YceI family protein [Pseudodesulfovibrio sediminis]BCS90021.1 sulfurtransferase [Pseudodesulfovibrio sediminis]